jgi:hypothetical protein
VSFGVELSALWVEFKKLATSAIVPPTVGARNLWFMLVVTIPITLLVSSIFMFSIPPKKALT